VKTNYVEQFKHYIQKSYDRSRKEIEDIWFGDEECYPDKHIGGSLLNDIINKFYEPLDFIAHLLEKKGVVGSTDIRITVMPSYEACTFYVVTYKELVLERGGKKAWYFCFDEQSFNKWVEEKLVAWERKIQNFSQLQKNIEELKTWYQKYQQAEGDKEVEDAYEKFMRVCEKTLGN